MWLRKTSIDSFPSMRCLCHGEDTGTPSDTMWHYRLGLTPPSCLTIDLLVWCVGAPQAAGPVPCSEGLHSVQTRGGILPGSGSHRCCAADAHACWGTSLHHRRHINHRMSVLSPCVGRLCWLGSLLYSSSKFWSLKEKCRREWKSAVFLYCISQLSLNFWPWASLF